MVGYDRKLQFDEECFLDLTAVMIDIQLMEATLVKIDAHMDEWSQVEVDSKCTPRTEYVRKGLIRKVSYNE
jgi:hypothetical protein